MLLVLKEFIEHSEDVSDGAYLQGEAPVPEGFLHELEDVVSYVLGVFDFLMELDSECR
jgi:hypothetical protein